MLRTSRFAFAGCAVRRLEIHRTTEGVRYMSKQKKAPKKAVSAKQVAIAKAVPTPLAVLGTVDERITDSLVALAGVLSADLTGPVLGRATLVIKKFEATAEALYENARKP